MTRAIIGLSIITVLLVAAAIWRVSTTPVGRCRSCRRVVEPDQFECADCADGRQW